MRKKFLFALAFVAACVGMTGCAQYDELSLVCENMSEMSDVYYFSDNSQFSVSLCSGKREDPYAYDGYSQNKVDFALITAQLDSCDDEMACVVIDGQEQNVLLEFNYKTANHVADLERKLTGNEQIFIKVGQKSANLVCKSANFGVSAQQAIKLGVETMQEFITPLCNQDEFNGECYLKVLDCLTGGFNEVFWLFSVLDRDGHVENIVISTNQPIVLADGNESMI